MLWYPANKHNSWTIEKFTWDSRDREKVKLQKNMVEYTRDSQHSWFWTTRLKKNKIYNKTWSAITFIAVLFYFYFSICYYSDNRHIHIIHTFMVHEIQAGVMRTDKQWSLSNRVIMLLFKYGTVKNEYLILILIAFIMLQRVSHKQFNRNYKGYWTTANINKDWSK